MAITADKMAEIADGDQAFWRVDTRRPPHELPKGVAADAVNHRFEDGRAWPRLGVNTQAWGLIYKAQPFDSPTWVLYNSIFQPEPWYMVQVQGLVIGNTYVFEQGNASFLTAAKNADVHYSAPIGTQILPGTFKATQSSYYLWATYPPAIPGLQITAVIYRAQNPVGYKRFNDPQGYDTQIILTDDWRDGLSEDGGQGRAWRIQAGNVPQEVPMNGHDVWGTTRAVPCFNGMVLLRQGNERHCFCAIRTFPITGSSSAGDTISVDTTALATGQPVTLTGITGAAGNYYLRVTLAGLASLYDTRAHAVAGGATGLFNVTVDAQTGTLSLLVVDPVSNRIQLNTQPNWVNGDRIYFFADSTVNMGSYFTGALPPQNNTAYFVKNIAGNQIELYSNQGLSTQVTFNGAVGRFWIERQSDFPGFYGNAAPPLLAQPNASGNTIWEVGFKSVPVTVNATNTSATTSVVTAPNHRLLPGDNVTVTGLHTPVPVNPTAIASAYVYPISNNAVVLYTTQAGALAQDATTVISLVDAQSGTLTKVGASGLPMPGGREGAFYQNRLIIINGNDTLGVSDPLDPLHFSPFTAAVTANTGESDPIQAIVAMGTNDALLILKLNEVLLLNNFSSGYTAWTLTTLTREYGCIAPLSVQQAGSDVWWLSRKGIASVQQTANGVLQGVADPVSKAMKKYIDQIDWRYAKQACAGYWNNRYLVAIPLKGQLVTATRPPVNNGVLSHNFLNMTLHQAIPGESAELEYGWEGLWTGAALQPVAFERLDVYGEERLCFVNYAGQVCWLGDGWQDGTTDVATSLTTRRYTGGNLGRKLWLETDLTLDTWGPNLTIVMVAPGVNEVVTLVANKTYDRTQHQVYGLPDYDPTTATPQTFNAPWRRDYQPTASELLAGAPDLHQNQSLPLRMRRSDWGIQIQINNMAGSCRTQSVDVSGMQKDYIAAENG